MEQNEFIKSLSFNDKKSLSQKCLKLVEEVGELAKVVLPFDSAHGTSHRFVDKEKILEEIADVHLTNFSIAYSLGFSDEDINNMILKKSIKWSSLQSKKTLLGNRCGTFKITTEYLLFAKKGKLKALKTIDSTWHNVKRTYENGYPKHSKKPDYFYELIEQTSPGLKLEMFARQKREGWHIWGNELQNDVELETECSNEA